jgi:DNA polymerase V
MRLYQTKETKNITFYKADITSHIELPYVDEGIAAGFPSPAQDYMDLSLDLNQALIKHPSATFYGRVKGDSMIDAGIEDGDILVIDRSIDFQDGLTAVCFIDGEFTVKKLKIEKEKIWLMPANKNYQPIEVKPDNEFIIWGIVTFVIKKML